MAFRYDEAVERGNDKAKRFLVPARISADQRERSLARLDQIIEEYGPAIDSYPTWHPLVSNHAPRRASTHPDQDCGYQGLDHTQYFVNAFITCPYGDGQAVVESVERLRSNPSYAWLSVEELDVYLYAEGVTPLLVSVEFPDTLGPGKTIPKNVAVPLMMLRELVDWPGSQVTETWDTMRHYFLGSPRGSRSSLFVNQETALAMKKVFDAMNETGMFGPVKGK